MKLIKLLIISIFFISCSGGISDEIVLKPSDQTLLELLAGSSSKTWRINAAQDAHFSNGAQDKKYPTYWEAYAFSKSNSGFYDDEYTFNINTLSRLRLQFYQRS